MGSHRRIRFCLGVTCDGISDVVSNESVLCIDRDGRMGLGHVLDVDTLRLIRDEQDAGFLRVGIERRAGREHGVGPDRLCGESPIESKENKQTEDSFQAFHLDS